MTTLQNVTGAGAARRLPHRGNSVHCVAHWARGAKLVVEGSIPFSPIHKNDINLKNVFYAYLFKSILIEILLFLYI